MDYNWSSKQSMWMKNKKKSRHWWEEDKIFVNQVYYFLKCLFEKKSAVCSVNLEKVKKMFKNIGIITDEERENIQIMASRISDIVFSHYRIYLQIFYTWPMLFVPME